MLGREQEQGKTDHFIGMEIPAAAHAHIGGETKQQRAEDRTRKTKAASQKKTSEQQPGESNVKQVLIYDRLSNGALRKPYDRSKHKTAERREKVLAHPDLERPREDSFIAQVIGAKGV